jgi:hypothetical protein
VEEIQVLPALAHGKGGTPTVDDGLAAPELDEEATLVEPRNGKEVLVQRGHVEDMVQVELSRAQGEGNCALSQGKGMHAVRGTTDGAWLGKRDVGGEEVSLLAHVVCAT